jgi:hypothetical protein
VVRNHEVVAAKPATDAAPPIILIRTESGNVLPVIKWHGYEGYGWKERLENRTFGRLKGAALEQAFKVVRDNGGLDIAGEYGSIEVQDSDFEVDLGLEQRQKEMNPDSKYEPSPDFKAKEAAMARTRRRHGL